MHDSHIHLALQPLKSNIDSVVNSFLENGGRYILTQGTDILDFDDTFKFARDYPDIIHVAIAIHPTILEETTVYKGEEENLLQKGEKLFEEFKQIFNKNREDITAIGETGLDYYQMSFDKSIKEEIKKEIKRVQREIFKKHIILGVENNLPLSIHARDQNFDNDCIKDTLQIVAEEGKGLAKGSFHSYTGDIDFLNDILDLGFFVGFNAIITYKSGGNVREILKETPLDRILFETDGPFLPTDSVRKNKKIKEKFAQPADIKEIMQVAAEVKNVPLEKLEKITDENYEKLFLNS